MSAAQVRIRPEGLFPANSGAGATLLGLKLCTGAGRDTRAMRPLAVPGSAAAKADAPQENAA